MINSITGRKYMKFSSIISRDIEEETLIETKSVFQHSNFCLLTILVRHSVPLLEKVFKV